MINVALLGFGRIGQMHAENINKNKDLKLLYVYEKIELLCKKAKKQYNCCLLYTSPSPRDGLLSRMPSSA